MRQMILLGDQELQLKSEEERLSNEIQALEALTRKIEENQANNEQIEIKRNLNIHSEKQKELTKPFRRPASIKEAGASNSQDSQANNRAAEQQASIPKRN